MRRVEGERRGKRERTHRIVRRSNSSLESLSVEGLVSSSSPGGSLDEVNVSELGVLGDQSLEDGSEGGLVRVLLLLVL